MVTFTPTADSHVVDATLKPIAYEQITALSTAKGFTTATYADARLALVQAESQNVRWRDDDTDPTATVGMQLEAARDIWYSGDLSTIKFIEEAASAKLNVSYYDG